MTEIETYSKATQAQLSLSDAQWDELRTYLEDLASDLDRAASDALGVSDIEESPPAIRNGTFDPGGWIGQYPGDIHVVANRFDKEEQNSLVSTVAEWADMIGATTFEAAFPVSPDILLDNRTQLGGYSSALIDITEVLRTQRLPTQVNRDQERGSATTGRPLLHATMQAEARGTPTVVSENLQFSFNTPANRLLVQFHAVLADRLHELTDRYKTYESAFSDQLQYHEAFLEEPLPRQLYDAAIEMDAAEPNLITAIREGQTGPVLELVDLWETFQRQRRLELRISDLLQTAVKPLSKLYELWCLGLLLDMLMTLTNCPPDTGELGDLYTFGDTGAKLHYDSKLRRHSNYLSPEFNVGSGRPDFALSYGDEVVWIGDAKCKSWTTLELSDYQRFFTYILDFLKAGDTGTILYADSKRPPESRGIRDFEVQHIPLRPLDREPGYSQLKDELKTRLIDAGVFNDPS
ncbi:hypothetical protein ACFQO4_09410 [Saliphagus sp. GCM10025334]